MEGGERGDVGADAAAVGGAREGGEGEGPGGDRGRAAAGGGGPPEVGFVVMDEADKQG